MTELEKRLHRCCFTGHRPEKLQASESEICAALEIEIRRTINDGYRTFITGMARGVDIWAAELVLKCRKEMGGIHLICELPHPDFEKGWRREWQERYREVLENAGIVKTISSHFSMGNYQKRNEWMVDHSSRLISVYNGESGGTRNTIQYAEKRGLEVVNCRLANAWVL